MSDNLNTEIVPTGGDQGAGNQATAVTVEELQARLVALEAEAAKQKKLKQEIIKERDELKKKIKPSDDNAEDYKQLWAQANEKAQKLIEKTKSTAIESALRQKLNKAGLIGDFVDAAVKLADRSLIEWDEDNGVDEQSVVASVQKLRATYPIMFEKKVPGVKAKEPAEGTTAGKSISRAEFMKLDPVVRAQRVREGWVVTN